MVWFLFKFRESGFYCFKLLLVLLDYRLLVVLWVDSFWGRYLVCFYSCGFVSSVIGWREYCVFEVFLKEVVYRINVGGFREDSNVIGKRLVF